MAAEKTSRTGHRIRSDLFRANVSTALALLTAAAGVGIALLTTGTATSGWKISPPIVFFLVYWLSFTAYYLWWTHRVYAHADMAAVHDVAARDSRARRSWTGKVSGLTGPTDWTAAAATMAVVVTVAIALSPGAREDPVVLLLGLATVASSWALMIYSFALDYMQVSVLQEPDETPHVQFDFPEEPRFADYLTFSVMVSTMAVGAPAQATSQAMWRKLRSHVLLAFIFNTVIVAMMVSLLFGGLTGG